MAEMLVDGAKLDACNTAEADAIRAKTGGSSPIPYDYANNKGFADAIAAIPSGGGSLPSVITKIDGGSFTLATDTKCNTYDIQTSLGESAKSFIVWTDDLTSFTTLANKAFTFSCVHLVNFESASGTTRYGMNFYQQRNANGSTYNGVYQMTYSDEPAKFSNGTRIKVYMTDTFYVANKTYKWVAWA